MNSRDRDLATLAFIIKEPVAYKDLHRENKESLANFKFEYPMAGPIYKAVTSTIEKYGVSPTLTECVEMVAEFADEHDYSPTSRELLLRETQNVYALQSTPQSGEVFINHIYAQESRALSAKISGMSREQFIKGYEDLQTKFIGLKTLGKQGAYDLGVAVYSTTGITKLVDKLYESKCAKVIPTGFKGWDEMLEGGIYPGEVFMLMAATGGFKTAQALNIADNVSQMRDKRAVYITFDNTDEEMGGRLYSRRLQQKIGRDFDPEMIKKEMHKSVWYGQEENFRLLNWLPQRFTPLDVAKALKLLQEEFREYDLAHGVAPEIAGHIDILFIDYLEKVKPLKSSDLFRQDLFLTVEEFVIIAKTWGMPVVILSQATKEAMKVETAQIWMSGESYAKLHPCAHVAILCQSDEDRQQVPNRLKLVNGKNRREHTNYVVNMVVDKATQTIIEDPNRPITSLNSVISTDAKASGGYEYELQQVNKLKGAIKAAQSKPYSAEGIHIESEPEGEVRRGVDSEGNEILYSHPSGQTIKVLGPLDTHLNGAVV